MSQSYPSRTRPGFSRLSPRAGRSRAPNGMLTSSVRGLVRAIIPIPQTWLCACSAIWVQPALAFDHHAFELGNILGIQLSAGPSAGLRGGRGFRPDRWRRQDDRFDGPDRLDRLDGDDRLD